MSLTNINIIMAKKLSFLAMGSGINIPDPESDFFHPEPITVSKLSEKLSGMFIPDSPSRMPDPDAGSGSATLLFRLEGLRSERQVWPCRF
jgi:hypothetical protein